MLSKRLQGYIGTFCFMGVLTLMSIPVVSAQQTKDAAPVPTQIMAAKKVFISNLGAEALGFRGGPDRAYVQFYSAIKAWGRYELTSTPADADLVFELSFASPAGRVLSGTSYPEPHLMLVILDPKTRIALWGINHTVNTNRDKDFDNAMDALVERVKKLTDSPVVSIR